ncbi:MAG: o-succinylbenzoate--CoA ligase [Ignavibacteriales bacterium]|nr:MAG: o-succinylbenzoate--CoA ligase [Ignavibacteriales bacterium]
MKSIKNLLFTSSIYDKNTPVLINNENSLTPFELELSLNRYAHTLKSSGVSKGELVPILLDNNINFIVTVISLWRVGAVPVPLSTKQLNSELFAKLDFLNSRLLITDNLFNGLNAKSIRTISVPSKDFNKHELVEHNTPGEEEIAVIIFTSGSSSKPKAVQLSFRNLFAGALASDQLLKHTESDKWLASLPFFHIGGFSILTRSLIFGIPVILPEDIDAKSISVSIEKFHPTLISLVAAQLSELLKIDFEFSSIKNCLIGGGPSSSSLMTEAINKGWKVSKVYGSTETSAMVAGFSVNDYPEKINSSGKIFDDVKIRIVDESGKELSSNNEGEIHIKSDSVMPGYLNNPELTSQLLVDGLYHTGDFGYLDDEGFLFITSRRSDIIVTGGENVNTFEVENVILSNEYVSETSVVGIADEKWGQVVCAAVVLKNNFSLSESELKIFLKENLASFKIPKKFIFIDELPKSPLSKIEKEKIRAMFTVE